MSDLSERLRLLLQWIQCVRATMKCEVSGVKFSNFNAHTSMYMASKEGRRRFFRRNSSSPTIILHTESNKVWSSNIRSIATMCRATHYIFSCYMVCSIEDANGMTTIFTKKKLRRKWCRKIDFHNIFVFFSLVSSFFGISSKTREEKKADGFLKANFIPLL